MPEKLPRALLVFPPVHDFALYDLYLKPFGLLRLGSMLKAGGWDVSFINALSSPAGICGTPARKPDGTGKLRRTVIETPAGIAGIRRHFARYGTDPDLLEALVAEERPDAVFITSGMTYWYRGVKEAVDIVRKVHPGVPVIVGGIYASLMPGHCLSICRPDFVAEGGAGDSLAAFLASKGLPGQVADGGELPLIDECWRSAGVIRLNTGCPMSCDYCASGCLSGGFTAGDPAAAYSWLREVSATTGTRNFAFYDDALLFNADRGLKPFLETVINGYGGKPAEYSFYTPNALHIRFLTPELAGLMQKAGFKDIRLGFESSSEDFHRSYDGKCSAGGLEDALGILRQAGFPEDAVKVYILAGLPGQYASEVEESVRFAAGQGARVSVSEFSPVPGSPMWEKCIKQCGFPIEEEPLFQNCSFFPMEWSGFTKQDMQRIKLLSQQAAYSGC